MLPGDPESSLLRLDDAFWDWWSKVDPSPPDNRMGWGHEAKATAHGAFRAGHEAPWEQYISVRRHGGVDLGAAVTYPHDDKVCVPLLHVVALAWSAVRLQWQLCERVRIDGPWELTLALRDIGGTVLMQFAEGWRQPLTGFGRGQTCADPAVLIRREMDTWPTDEAAVRNTAFDLADEVEQCWGVRQRVFLIPNGGRQGEFGRRRLT